jgi:hypothetical protein
VSLLYLGACGVLALAAALLPIPFLARALVGAILGLGALALFMAAPAAVDWRFVATVSTCFLLPAALLHRWRYRGSLFARLLVAACVLTVLAIQLIPSGGGVPLLALFNALGAGGAATVVRLWPLLLLLLALLSLLAFLGSGSTGLAQVWAICLLLYLPLQGWLEMLTRGGPIWAMLQPLSLGLALLVYLTLAAHGLSQIMAAASRSTR